MTDNPDKSPTINISKKTLLEEFRHIMATFFYLAVSLSILETYRSLVLLQYGIDNFLHGYGVALVAALTLCKPVALAQKLPFFHVFSRHRMVWQILYQSILMTIIVACVRRLDELILHGRGADPALVPDSHALTLLITHQTGALVVFFVLYTIKALDRELGEGTLARMLLGPRRHKDEDNT